MVIPKPDLTKGGFVVLELRKQIFNLWLTFGASLSFLIIGLVRGYSSSAIPSMEALDPHIIQHSEQKSWIGAIPPLGAFAGSMLSGALMQRAGRKRTLQLTAPLWVAGWLILGFAKYFPLILVGRAISGVGVGFVLATAQVYVSECCDPEIRGRLGSLPTLSMSLGILISYVAGNWLYWRYLAFLSAVFCVAMFVALMPLPESPVWLEAQGLDASAAIKWLHLSARATAVVKDDVQEKVEDPKNPPSLFTRKVFFSSVVIKPLVIGFSLLIFQQFSGIDAVIFFTVEIFKSAGSKLDAMTATIIVGVVQLVSNAVSTMLVDRAGRRPLLLISAAIMCVSMASMGAAFYFEIDKQSWLGYLPIGSLVVFMMGFSLGFGGLPFLLLGELFPAHYRSQLSAMASAVNLLSMFSVIKSYHALEVSECCDPEIRGRLGSLPTLSMSLGILISYVAGNWLYWRYLAFLSAVFCVAMFVALMPLPESPVWLEAQGLDASAAIKWLHLSARATAVVKDDVQEYLPIGSLVVFMMGFSLGFGGLPFLLLGELFPAHYRSQLSAMASAVNLLSMFSVIKSYHALEGWLTSAGTFWMYSCFCALAFFFVLFVVPETKGKSLAEIEQHFRGKKKTEAVKLQTVL